MKWATRPGCHVDRAACAWLIRRFVDPASTFLFVADQDAVPADATPFDMRGVALSHHGEHCSFETFLVHYGLTDEALAAIGELVHEADLADERFDAPEAPGLDVLIRGLSLVLGDAELLAVTERLFDGLYAVVRERVTLTAPGT